MGIRLNKRLVELSVCSRRNADKLISEGKVLVNGHIAILGEQVNENDEITVNGDIVRNDVKKILIAYNKPKGVVCTESNAEKSERIVDKIKELGFDMRLFTIGRLDKESTGLILITNDGDIAKEITNTHNDYEKEYEVRVNKPITNEFLKSLTNGVVIEIPDDAKDGKTYVTDDDRPMKKVKTKPSKVHKFGDELYRFSITITQGLNRQVRRMCRALGYHVVDLKRTRIMKLSLGDLKTGEYRIIKRSDII